MTLLPMPLSKRSIRIYLERRLMPVFMDFGKHVSKLDRHEICRYLELFYALKYRKLKLQASSSNQSQMPSSSVKAEAYQTAPSNQFTAQYVADGLKGIDKLVVDYLQQPGSLAREAGVHQEELAKQLGIPLDKILVSLNGLVDEGLVYSSIDDCHFRSTGLIVFVPPLDACISKPSCFT